MYGSVLVLRQITEKSKDYKKPAYICFIDLVEAFDRVQLKPIVHLFYDRHIPHNLVKTIENIYMENLIQAEINGELTNLIPVGNGIRQGDSLSPLLFNIIMDEIIKKVSKLRGYKIEEKRLIYYVTQMTRCWLLKTKTIYNGSYTNLTS